MSLKLNSSGGGSVTLQEPSTATNGTLTLPAGTGTVAVNGLSSNIASATAQASTSGTSIDFTGIPSWVKRITVMFSGVSTNGASIIQIQIGTSGGVQATGYAGAGGLIFAGFSAYASNFTTGFGTTQTGQGGAGQILSGSATLCLLNSSNGTWVANGIFAREDATGIQFTGGTKTLSGTLDRVRITTVNGTDTFDAGTINILYE
jgi:hypothetical protein